MKDRSAYFAAYREMNRERLRESARAYNAAHSAERAAWAKANPDKIVEANRKWASANNAVTANNRARYRARQNKAFVEAVDRLVVFDRDGGVCQICGEPIGSSPWEIDHIVPLIAGGQHSYANSQLSHRTCNRSKGGKILVNRLPLVQDGLVGSRVQNVSQEAIHTGHLR